MVSARTLLRQSLLEPARFQVTYVARWGLNGRERADQQRLWRQLRTTSQLFPLPSSPARRVEQEPRLGSFHPKYRAGASRSRRAAESGRAVQPAFPFDQAVEGILPVMARCAAAERVENCLRAGPADGARTPSRSRSGRHGPSCPIHPCSNAPKAGRAFVCWLKFLYGAIAAVTKRQKGGNGFFANWGAPKRFTLHGI